MHKNFDRICGTVHGLRVQFRRLSDEERTDASGELSRWVYLGVVASGGPSELWDEFGRWREDGAPHPLDLALVMAVAA